MKRDRDRGNTEVAAAGGSSTRKLKMWEEQPQPDAGMDELFAVLGYKVKSTDMADVAEKLEQLEMAMGTTTEDGVSLLSTDTVHYNPSDLSGWVDSMLSEFNPTQIGISGHESSPCSSNLIYDDDLRAIPGGAIFSNYDNKRMKLQQPSPAAVPTAVLVDSQEPGVRLVHTLMACAEAVQHNNMKLANALVKHVGVISSFTNRSYEKSCYLFRRGFGRKIYKIYPNDNSLESSYSDALQMHFYESGPYLKFAHFTANQAILEAFSGASKVHVIDFSLKQGMQWPALMQALALRPGGPPSFKLTGIGPPQPDNSDALQEVGWKLARLADTIGVEFEFKGYVANSLADLDVGIFDISPSNDESIAVNSVFELHRLMARPGGIERVLNLIKSLNPEIVTIVEQEANHNGVVFLDRFNEALHYYSTMFDSLETSGLTRPDSQDSLMTEVYLGRQICNVVACEGVERVERHETLAQWRVRMGSAGFDPVHLGSNAFKQASMLLALFGGGDGFRVEENDGCLMLGWHTRPLIATSAWRLRRG
ncbi:hypothetical protein RD792_001092 [Penstemon davidsonii]|uniref:DELLA protein n=1 Tax=Penstemon davidsonii TaxID=160366 RepID=A0ABR0DMF9_9LAMI|nr:hypothetical protein RD792_001092 [Penstemon davidsonii]